MQAVTKLEKSFNLALAKLGADADNDKMASENATLSARVKNLEAVRTNKDEKIKVLREKNARITEREHEIAKQIDGLKQAEVTSQKEITELRATIKKASAAKADVLMKVETLKGQVKAADAGQVKLADISDLKAEISQLKEKSKSDDVKLKDYINRVRALRGALRQIRSGLKDKVLNAKDVNAAMQAELEALHVQRETDLAEVNAILDKLTPLVEGK